MSCAGDESRAPLGLSCLAGDDLHRVDGRWFASTMLCPDGKTYTFSRLAFGWDPSQAVVRQPAPTREREGGAFFMDYVGPTYRF